MIECAICLELRDCSVLTCIHKVHDNVCQSMGVWGREKGITKQSEY